MATQNNLTVDQLISYLVQYREVVGGDTEVRLATEPAWPFEDSVSKVGISRPSEGEPSVVYLAQGKQIGYLPSAAREALGWE